MGTPTPWTTGIIPNCFTLFTRGQVTQTPIRLTLQPAGLPDRVILSANVGDTRIRLWRNANRTGEIVLPKTWNTIAATPSVLHVEGVTNSITARDIALTLTYDENPPNKSNPLFKCEDRVRLTVFKVDITPANMNATESLDSGTFTCTVTPAGLSPEYEWLTGAANGAWPATAGNSPKLDYSAATDSSTKVKETRWFAPTPSRRQVIDGCTASYNINCKVTVGDVECKAQSASVLNVSVNMTGQFMRPAFTDWQSIQVQKVGSVWQVTGQGSFRRTAPSPSVNMPATSQFYSKAMTHENKHVTQWTTEAPWKDLFDADSLYTATLSALASNVSEADLRSQIFAAILAKFNADNTVANNTVCDREQGAFDAMNAVAPDFLELDEDDWKPLYGCP